MFSVCGSLTRSHRWGEGRCSEASMCGGLRCRWILLRTMLRVKLAFKPPESGFFDNNSVGEGLTFGATHEASG